MKAYNEVTVKLHDKRLGIINRFKIRNFKNK